MIDRCPLGLYYWHDDITINRCPLSHYGWHSNIRITGRCIYLQLVKKSILLITRNADYKISTDESDFNYMNLYNELTEICQRILQVPLSYIAVKLQSLQVYYSSYGHNPDSKPGIYDLVP